MNIESRKDTLNLLNLNPLEQQLLTCVSGIAKTITQISRHSGIPRTSLLYMLKKLEKKEYVVKIIDGKQKFWRSNISKITLYISNSQKMKKS